MQPLETVQCVKAAGFEAIFVVLFIVIGIISSIIKSAKEKRLREERVEKMKKLNKGPSPYLKPQAGKTKPKPSSIEDFLRELAGEPAKKEPAPEPKPQEQPAQWRAPRHEVQEFLEDQRRKQQDEERQRAQEKRRRIQERKRALKAAADTRRRAARAAQDEDAYHVAHDVHGDAYF